MKVHPSAGMFCLIALLAGGASLFFLGPVPGDVLATSWLQTNLGTSPEWAHVLTRTAKAPYLWGTLIVGSALAVLAGHWRLFIAPLLAYAAIWFVDKGLRSLIYVPKPDAELVAVAGASSASGLPSTFALTYAAIFGAVIWSVRKPVSGKVFQLICWALILGGCTARIVLGGHWTSQMIASAALGLVVSYFTTAIVKLIVGLR